MLQHDFESLEWNKWTKVDDLNFKVFFEFERRRLRAAIFALKVHYFPQPPVLCGRLLRFRPHPLTLLKYK